MSNNTSSFRYPWMVGAILLGGIAVTVASADVSLLGTQYQQDDPLSEYLCYWHDRNYPTSCGATYPGANAHVFIKNNGASAVTLDDVVLNTYGLTYVLKQADYNGHIANSIWIRYDNPPQALLDAGEPAWFKMDPASIPAGGVGHVVVRLRRVPVASPLAINVDTSANILNTSLTVNANAPQLTNISFSQDLTKVYLYWRRTGGAAPTTVKMDGTVVTATTVGDTSNFGVSVISLGTPLTEMSYHVFQGVYGDGSTATGGASGISPESTIPTTIRATCTPISSHRAGENGCLSAAGTGSSRYQSQSPMTPPRATPPRMSSQPTVAAADAGSQPRAIASRPSVTSVEGSMRP